MTLKYAVYPGYVLSKADGQHHFIDATRLMFLYRVKPDECMIVRALDLTYMSGSEYWRQLARAEMLIPLRPRHDGDYTLPTGIYATQVYAFADDIQAARDEQWRAALGSKS